MPYENDKKYKLFVKVLTAFRVIIIIVILVGAIVVFILK